jgi:transcriptional regulator GlxA family with amidase domain
LAEEHAERRTSRPSLRVGFVLAPDFTLSALSLFVDVLRLAADEGDRSRRIRCDWAIMSNNSSALRSSCGLDFTPTSRLIDPGLLDYVVVVGGLLHTRKNLDPEAMRYLRSAAEAGTPLIGLCTGSFVLARAGLMEGFRCCVSWYHAQDFDAEFPNHRPVADQIFVVDGPRITCSGGAGVADLAAFLVERHLGKAVAQKALHILLLQHARSATDAQPHTPIVETIGEDRVRRAVLIMEQNVARPLSIERIAAKLRVSERHLERLFIREAGRTPASIYREIRLHHARALIENSNLSMTDVADATGFCDSAHFSRQFKRFFAASPSDVRRGKDRVVRPSHGSIAGVT